MAAPDSVQVGEENKCSHKGAIAGGRQGGTLDAPFPTPAPTPQKAGKQEEEEEEVEDKKPDPLHQLVLHFSRTALTEKR